MSGNHIRQLKKSESNLFIFRDRRGPRIMTGDELAIGLLDLLRLIAVNPDRDPDSQAAAAAAVLEIEARIRLQAACNSGPVYEARLARLAATGHDVVGYIIAITPEGEHDSLDTPRLMARRASLWARPDIAALVGGNMVRGTGIRREEGPMVVTVRE